jgi:diamine N-acetyltransferase
LASHRVISLDSRIRRASLVDCDLLVELMSEFYAEFGTPFDRRRAHAAFSHLVAHESLGRVWLLQDHGKEVGYAVLTLGYSLEYGGCDAFLDDLFVRPANRGHGLGKLAVDVVRDACIELGVRALHLEVSRDNEPAATLYLRSGFVDNDRRLFTLRLEGSAYAH